jgi:DNA-binding beta-propeller fold protein YncE
MRFVFNTEPDDKGTHVLVMEAATQKVVGEILVPSKKAEGAEADGAGTYYLVGQDRDEMYVLDTKGLKVLTTWSLTSFCGKPTGVATDAVNRRVFVTCRGREPVKPAFVVLDAASGAKVYSVEIGGGSDSLIYDAPTRRLYSAKGVNANLSVIEQVDADNYRLLEHLGTEAWVRTLAMDHATVRLFAQTASGASDASKKIVTSVSPYYINTIFPNTYRVLTYGK